MYTVTSEEIKNIDIKLDQYLEKNILLNKEYNSLKLELESWTFLNLIGLMEQIELPILIGHINARKKINVSLSTACRVFIASYFSQLNLPTSISYDQAIQQDKLFQILKTDTNKV